MISATRVAGVASVPVTYPGAGLPLRSIACQVRTAAALVNEGLHHQVNEGSGKGPV